MKSSFKITGENGFALIIEPRQASMTVHSAGIDWQTDPACPAYVLFSMNGNTRKALLCGAHVVRSSYCKTGVGEGIRTRYSGWTLEGTRINAAVDTYIWIDAGGNSVHFEFNARTGRGVEYVNAAWPAPFLFRADEADAYTVLPMMQGTLIPSGWGEEVRPVEPWDGDIKFYERAAYMPWWGQVAARNGYIAIAETAWDAGYHLEHPAHGPTSIGVLWHASMGAVSYRRTLQMRFLSDCDYNDLCVVYREYAEQHGQVVTLAQKRLRTPGIDALIGSPVVHTGICYQISPESAYYDRQDPDRNEQLATFEYRAAQLRRLKGLGLEKAYLHLDGWGRNGYDSMHPDVFPPCEKAGGTDGMRELAKTCRELGYLFAIHDQYRDYYRNADTYDESQSVVGADGAVHGESVWYGGRQTYLCQQLAPHYVRRNYARFQALNIPLDGAYLDVFSVISLEECHSPEHRMTRKECMEKRIECFELIRAQGMLASSEEAVDWAVPHLDLVHHAPYPLTEVGSGPARGIPVPLFSLVYHDCLVVPWTLAKGGWGIPDGESGYLYALLNAGTGYLDIDADEADLEKLGVLLGLQKRLAHCRMVRHEFLGDSRKRQRALYSDGTCVEIDLERERYRICGPEDGEAAAQPWRQL